MAGGALNTIASLVIRVGVDPTGVKAGMAQVNAQVKSGMAAVKGQTTGMAAAAAHPAVGIAAVAATAIAGIGIKMAADFDAKMTQSLAIMGDVSDEMRMKMEKAARDVGRTTSFSAGDAAESYFFLASAGLDAQAQIAAMPKVANFAQAGMFDMARATDLLTDAQSALGMTIRDDPVKNMENMVRVSDVLVKANTLANASVEQFSEALTNGAGAALRSVNKDVEEGVAVLAAYADQGVKGLLAGSSLDRLIRMMPSAALKNADAYKRLGIEVFDSAGNMVNMGDIVTDISSALDGMSDAEKTAALESLGFQARLQGIIKPLLGTGQLIKDYESGVRDAGGITDEVAAKQLESFNQQLGLLIADFQDISISIGQALLPVLREFVGMVKAVVSPIADWIAANKGLVDTFAPLIAGMAALRAAPMLLKGVSMFLPMGMMGAGGTGMFASLGTRLGGVFGKAFGAVALLYLGKELIDTYNEFNAKVAKSQQDLDTQVAGIAEQTTAQVFENLAKTSEYMNDVQGWQRMVGDTWGGKQQMDALLGFADRLYERRAELTRTEVERSIKLLTDAEKAAIDRGNKDVADSLANTRRILEDRLKTAGGGMGALGAEAKGAQMAGINAAQQGPVAVPDMAPAISHVGRQLAGARAAFRSAMRTALEPFVTETQAAWDHVQSILKGQPPKLIPMEKRMEQIGRAMRKAYRNLNKAVKADDPINAAYWEQQLLALKDEQNTFKNANSRSWKSIKKDLDAAGINHTRFTGKWKKAKAALVLADQNKSRQLARATPEALAAKQAELQTVMDRTMAIVEDPMSALPAKASSWGTSMGSMFAAGIRSQIAEAAAAADEPAAAVAPPLETGSPPKTGPLKHIDKWGAVLAQVFTDPFRKEGVRRGRMASEAVGAALRPGMSPGQVPTTSGMRLINNRGRGDIHNHFHIGTLIADDRGIDELQRRMDKRSSITDRRRRRDFETPTGRLGKN